MLYFDMSVLLLLVAPAALSVASEKIVDPELLASLQMPTSNTFNNYSLDSNNCDEWDDWEASEEVQDVWHYYRSGYDNDGTVVYVSEFGKLNYRKLEKKSDEVVQDFWRYYEQCILRCEYDAGSRNYSDDGGIVMLYDFEGFTLANYASVRALQHSLKMFTALERLNKIINYGFIFNVNYAGESFIQLAKPFLGDALNRFEIHGTSAQKWKPKLLRKIPPLSLPPSYGGHPAWKPLPVTVCSVH